MAFGDVSAPMQWFPLQSHVCVNAVNVWGASGSEFFNISALTALNFNGIMQYTEWILDDFTLREASTLFTEWRTSPHSDLWITSLNIQSWYWTVSGQFHQVFMCLSNPSVLLWNTNTSLQYMRSLDQNCFVSSPDSWLTQAYSQLTPHRNKTFVVWS